METWDVFWLFWQLLSSIIHDFVLNPKMNETTYFMSVRVQAMAMFLHSLDDHLCDGQLSTGIVKLHLRTSARLANELGFKEMAKEFDAMTCVD
ncbi:MAG: hypothetical protein H7A23_26390 [Leptospiraceae bacterium]|nr:hypothetical protein [Leptospiraceae bacterium]MCP5498101.1 hypothetical protein [Leptospiraceae bacterium]